MAALQHVPVGPMDPRRFESVLLPEEYESLLELIERGSRALQGRVIWNVNSTAKGGGVVELLRPLLGYSRGAGVDARWIVISGNSEFFDVTKRIHNRLHGFEGDGGPLGRREHAVYQRTLAAAQADLVPLVRRRDIVILHDPQTAGLVDAVRRTGATVIWRCHVGRDHGDGRARQAWDFLRRYVIGADAFVFSRAAFAWEGLPEEKLVVVHPSIDAFSPKNQALTRSQTLAILSRSRLVPDGTRHVTFLCSDGTPGRVDRRADMIEDAPLSQDVPLVTQISRWDRLKDPLGVVRGFAEHVAPATRAHLMLAGPSTESVADDPEGAEVFAAVREAWHELAPAVRRRVHLASLPMDDVEENAAIVNALQRHSSVIVQKSLAEGFGLTVAEAMWKSRPVVASRIGGIQDQIVNGESGVLVDAYDLAQYGDAVATLLTEPELARRIGDAAHIRVRDHFLGPYHLRRYFELISRLVDARESSAVGSP